MWVLRRKRAKIELLNLTNLSIYRFSKNKTSLSSLLKRGQVVPPTIQNLIKVTNASTKFLKLSLSISLLLSKPFQS